MEYPSSLKILNKVIGSIILMMNIELGIIIDILIEFKPLDDDYHILVYSSIVMFLVLYYSFSIRFNNFFNLITTSIILFGIILFFSNKYSVSHSDSGSIDLSDLQVLMVKVDSSKPPRPLEIMTIIRLMRI